MVWCVVQVRRLLACVESLGSEGLILREGASRFQTGRTPSIIKVKQFYEGDAMVVGKVPGKESVIVLTKEHGSRFDIAWHKGDRLGPMPSNGTVLTYVYPGTHRGAQAPWTSCLLTTITCVLLSLQWLSTL